MNRELKKCYDTLWEHSLQLFEDREFTSDPFLGSEKNNDTRYGVTLLARPSPAVKQAISKALEAIKAAAPRQYYYPLSDLHMTVLSIISCYPGFLLSDINRSEYQQIVHSAIAPITPFKIHFRGITASPDAVMVQGFPEDNQLEAVRNSLRQKFKQSGLQHSIDKRYQLKTAHITIMRFKGKFSGAETFIATLAGLRDRDFGSCEIEQLELAGNNWYHQKEKIKLVDKFVLYK